MAQIVVEQIGFPQVERIKELFSSSGNLPFQYFPDLSRERLVEYHFKKTSEALESGRVSLFGAALERQPLGLLVLETLPWDTEVLGFS